MRPYRRFRSLGVGLVVPLLIALASCTPPEQSEPSSTALQTASPAPSNQERPTLEDLAPGLLPAQPTFTQPATQLETTGPAVTIDFSASAPTGEWSSQNIGLSFEATTLANPLWDPNAGYLDELLVALHGLGLRFGGNSVDRSTWWTSTGEPAPEWSKATVTPADFERLAETVATSDAKVTLARSCSHGDVMFAMVGWARGSLTPSQDHSGYQCCVSAAALGKSALMKARHQEASKAPGPVIGMSGTREWIAWT